LRYNQIFLPHPHTHKQRAVGRRAIFRRGKGRRGQVFLAGLYQRANCSPFPYCKTGEGRTFPTVLKSKLSHSRRANFPPSWRAQIMTNSPRNEVFLLGEVQTFPPYQRLNFSLLRRANSKQSNFSFSFKSSIHSCTVKRKRNLGRKTKKLPNRKTGFFSLPRPRVRGRGDFTP